jgi:membrane protein
MNLRLFTRLLRRSWNDWNDDNAPRLGAALAFYTILSISPLTILVLAIISLVFDRASAQTHLLEEVRALTGPEGRNAIQSLLVSGQKAFSGIFATLLGMLTLLFGASAVFGELRSALNTIWEAEPRNESSIRGLIRERVFSFGMVIGIGFVLLASLLASAGLDVMAKFFSNLLPVPPLLLGVFDFFVSLGGIAILFGMIFRYVPETKVEWTDVRVGAVATALLFTIGKLLLGLYLGKASPGSAYGAAGSLVVTVIWVYYSAQVFYFGAEFTHVYAMSKSGQPLASSKDANSKEAKFRSTLPQEAAGKH